MGKQNLSNTLIRAGHQYCLAVTSCVQLFPYILHGLAKQAAGARTEAFSEGLLFSSSCFVILPLICTQSRAYRVPLHEKE
eukprot:1160877-Pelagomonas_calceolata.AAC.8